MGQLLNKYFSGYQSSLSIDLLVNALELHYEGLTEDCIGTLKQGFTDLISQCGQEPYYDQLKKLLDEQKVRQPSQNLGEVDVRDVSESTEIRQSDLRKPKPEPQVLITEDILNEQNHKRSATDIHTM